MIERHSSVIAGQWRGPWFYIQIGTTCFTFGDRGIDYYAPGLEILTPNHWLRWRRGKPR